MPIEVATSLPDLTVASRRHRLAVNEGRVHDTIEIQHASHTDLGNVAYPKQVTDPQKERFLRHGERPRMASRSAWPLTLPGKPQG